MLKKKFPVGVDIFEKVIKQNFYYVDKTGLISELLHNWGEMNLFTRPRRFGKTRTIYHVRHTRTNESEDFICIVSKILW